MPPFMETTISGSVYDLGVVCKVSDVGHGTKLGKDLKMKKLIIFVGYLKVHRVVMRWGDKSDN